MIFKIVIHCCWHPHAFCWQAKLRNSLCIAKMSLEFCVSSVKIVFIHLAPNFTYQTSDIFDCECYLMQQLQFYLTVFHPYKALRQFIEDANMSEHIQVAWSIVTDSYYSDVCLQHAPHLIALAAIYIVGITESSDSAATPPIVPQLSSVPAPFVVPLPEKLDVRVRKWFDQLNVHMKPVCYSMYSNNV